MIKNKNYDPSLENEHYWNAFYEEWKLKLDEYWKNRGHRYFQVSKFISKNSRSILDVGCGLGAGFKVFESHNYSGLCGCDVSSVAVEVCNAKFPRCDVVHLDAAHLGQLERRWDVGLLIQIVEHLEDPAESIKSVLKYVDELIVSVPNKTGALGNIPCHMWLFSVEDFVSCGAEILKESPVVVSKFKGGEHYEFDTLSQ